MKALKFDPSLVHRVLSGEKTSTWRLFDDKNLAVGDRLVFINKESGEEFAIAVVTDVREKLLGDITTEDEVRQGHERFRSDQDRLDTYRGYYGDRVTPDTVVKMIEYKLLDILGSA